MIGEDLAMGWRNLLGQLKRSLVPARPAQVEYDPGAWQKLDGEWDNNFTKTGWLGYRLNIVEWVLSLEGSHQEMLDTGCHIGHFIEELRRRGYSKRYVGLDITPQFVERAKARLPQERFEIGDVRELPFPDRSFDLVLCVGVLMHLPEVKSPLAEVFRIARKHVLLSTYGSRTTTYSQHDTQKGFLNYFYAKSDILAEVPHDWQLVEYKEFERPHRPNNSLISQYLLRFSGAEDPGTDARP
jgi:SAM-dependent methyltransferase